MSKPTIIILLILLFGAINLTYIPGDAVSIQTTGTNGPLNEWPDFTPIGYITAPHPDNPEYQTHLYGDWEELSVRNSFFYKMKK